MAAISTPIHTNRHSIERVLGAQLPVILVFWRPTDHAPRLDGDLEQVARDYAGKALVARVNIQEEADLAVRYRISGTPSLVFLNRGQVLATVDRAVEDTELRRWLEHMVNGGPQPAATPRSAGAGQTPPTPQAPTGSPVTLTDANFAQMIHGDKPLLVDFWAAWCGPCRMIAPAVEQLAREFQGRAVVGKLNVDENQRTAQKYDIMGIPALLIFKNGQVVDRLVGVQPAGVLRQRLSRHTG